jgi:hypothetical protein
LIPVAPRIQFSQRTLHPAAAFLLRFDCIRKVGLGDRGVTAVAPETLVRVIEQRDPRIDVGLFRPWLSGDLVGDLGRAIELTTLLLRYGRATARFDDGLQSRSMRPRQLVIGHIVNDPGELRKRESHGRRAGNSLAEFTRMRKNLDRRVDV